MSTYVIIPNDSDLYHHGIKGQRWGVRRYQNYDGSYTKKGLKRYQESETAYTNAKGKLKEAKASKNTDDIKAAKQEVKATRQQMNSDWKQLKRDYVADQGKELYRKGHTITSNQIKLGIESLAISSIATAAAREANRRGAVFVTRQGNIPVSRLISAAGTLANAAALLNTANQNRKLRAYYTHSSTKKK